MGIGLKPLTLHHLKSLFKRKGTSEMLCYLLRKRCILGIEYVETQRLASFSYLEQRVRIDGCDGC